MRNTGMSSAPAGAAISTAARARKARRNSMAASVSSLLAGAGKNELLLDLERREPWPDAGFLIDMAAEMLLRARRGNAHRQLVLAGSKQFDIVAVVRAVIRHHRHHLAGHLLIRANLLQLIVDRQRRNPL